MDKPKNVPEELKTFLETNGHEWFTNDQLAERLSHTPSGIRNAVTKLKNSGLVKTRMAGSLAYRGWHTAPNTFELPLPELQKKMAARRCGGCSTTYSRYWRSDLEQPGWLCNNCGMNQRRGRGVNRVNQTNEDDDCYHEHSYEEHHDDEDADPYNDNEEDEEVRVAPKRRPPIPTYVDPSRRKCGHCLTTKSAGKWRRDREYPERYLCNKCGMNQRRSQMRAETQMKAALEQAASMSEDGRQMRGMALSIKHDFRFKSSPCCNLCGEIIPTFELTDCCHRVCGECIPGVIKGYLLEKSIHCPVCVKTDAKLVSNVTISEMGLFVDSL